MTAPEITSRALVEAFHPVAATGAGRIRSSLKTVMGAASKISRAGWSLWEPGTDVVRDDSRVLHGCPSGLNGVEELSTIIKTAVRA
ncbi:hypothetical protein ARTHROSP310_11700 [Arthrobacter sp. AD-310]